MEIRRLISLAVSLILLCVIGYAIWVQLRTHVHGLVGSEKEDFFNGRDVKAALASRGLYVDASPAGSREIVEEIDRRDQDFGFPSGDPAANELMRKLIKQGVSPEPFTPFSSPIIIASWRPVAEVLVENGIARKAGSDYYMLDLTKLLALIEQHKRWDQLHGGQQLKMTTEILIRSSDVRSSNSAEMYLALASYIDNRHETLSNEAQTHAVLKRVSELFTRQGSQQRSSGWAFAKDYLQDGPTKTPLLVAYEAQMVFYWMHHPHGDTVIMYPQPEVSSHNVLVPYDEKGLKVANALEAPDLQALAREYGFRTGPSGDGGPELWSEHGVDVPTQLDSPVDPPAYELLDKMITYIERQY